MEYNPTITTENPTKTPLNPNIVIDKPPKISDWDQNKNISQEWNNVKKKLSKVKKAWTVENCYICDVDLSNLQGYSPNVAWMKFDDFQYEIGSYTVHSKI